MFTLVGEGVTVSTYLDIIRFVLGEHNNVSISPKISALAISSELENKLASSRI